MHLTTPDHVRTLPLRAAGPGILYVGLGSLFAAEMLSPARPTATGARLVCEDDARLYRRWLWNAIRSRNSDVLAGLRSVRSASGLSCEKAYAHRARLIYQAFQWALTHGVL